MTSRETVNEWLSFLSFALDAEGTCALSQGTELLILVEVPDDSPVCHLYGPVLPAPEAELQAVWFQHALELNQFARPLGGCWLAYDERESMLMLCHNLVVEKTSATEFSNALQNFAQSIRTARQMMTPDAETTEDLQDLADITAG
jgi:hypothetical protein